MRGGGFPFREGRHDMVGVFEYLGRTLRAYAFKDDFDRDFTSQTGRQVYRTFYEAYEEGTGRLVRPFQWCLIIDTEGDCWLKKGSGEVVHVGTYRDGWVDVTIPAKEEARCPVCGGKMVKWRDVRLRFKLTPLREEIVKRCAICGKEFATTDPFEKFCSHGCERRFRLIPESDNLYPYYKDQLPPRAFYGDWRERGGGVE